MIIRDYEPRDLAAVLQICNHYILTSTATFEVTPLTPEEMARRMEGAMVCETDGNVAGYAYVHPWKERPCYWPTVEITIYLHPEATGKGLGRELVTALLHRTKAKEVIACITADNKPSIRLFESLGFRQVSYFRGVGEKFGQTLDVTDLQLSLCSPDHL